MMRLFSIVVFYGLCNIGAETPQNIIEQVMEKSNQQQKLLFERHYATLLKIAFRYVSTYEQAIEMTYHGFVKIFREVTRLRISEGVNFKVGSSPWVKKIFIIALVDKIKSELHLHTPRPIPTDIWQEPGTQSNLERETIHIELIKVMKALPVTYRLVFNLYIIDGFSHAEIANLLRITVKNSKYNLLEAKKYCAAYQNGEFCSDNVCV